MEAFLAQYGLLVVLGFLALWLVTKGRRHAESLKSEASDMALKAVLRELNIDSLPDTQKIAKMAKIANAIKTAAPSKVATKAIDVLTEELASIQDRQIPMPVDEAGDIDGLGAALNNAIRAEEKREKVRRGLRKATEIGLKILKSTIS